MFADRPAEITGVIVKADRLLPPNRQLKKLKDSRLELRGQLTQKEEIRLRERIAGLQGQVTQIFTIQNAEFGSTWGKSITKLG